MVLSFLPVPGALVAYQCLGTGPYPLTIPGANGDAVIFNDVTPHLAQNFTVCTYDRRGYTNSTLTSPATSTTTLGADRLHQDADDAAALIAHITGGEPALVFATSSGAIVSMDLLKRHSEALSFLIAHQPPLSFVLDGTWGGEVDTVFQSGLLAVAPTMPSPQ